MTEQPTAGPRGALPLWRRLQGDKVFAAALVLVSLLLLASTFFGDQSVREQEFGTQLLPRAGLVLLLFGSLLIVLRRQGSAAGERDDDWVFAIIVPIVCTGYIFMAYSIGPIVATVVVLPAFAYLGGARRARSIIVATLATLGVVVVAFLWTVGTWFPPTIWLF